MSTVLGIVGSPRRGGNTQRLMEAVLQGVEAAGGSAELVRLRDARIAECEGCHACWTEGACSKRDDMLVLYPRIEAASALVLGTPVYWYGPTALMKAMLDRFVYFNCPEHRPAVRGKPAGLVVPFEDTDLATAAPLVAMFERSFEYLEMRMIPPLLVPGVTLRGEVQQHPEPLARARELGARLAGG